MNTTTHPYDERVDNNENDYYKHFPDNQPMTAQEQRSKTVKLHLGESGDLEWMEECAKTNVW